MNNINEPLSIRRFFAGKHVLLTGSTGFLAKAVMEKVLHDLPDIGGIHLLIRPRLKPDGSRVDARERLHEEILRNSAFGRLREKFGEDFERFCEEKITCITGDLTMERLGLDEKAYAELAGKIHVIINSAATVVFDERLDLALSLNTMGPMRLLELARAANAIYVHVSTAYVSGMRTGNVPEKLLTPLEAIHAQMPPGSPRPERFEVVEEIAYLNRLVEEVKAECQQEIKRQGWEVKSDESRDLLNARLVVAGMKRSQQFGWNDTYTFTKFLGEQLIYQNHGRIPTVIVRPSIIESSLREPEPGWLDGLRMADPIIIGFGKGRLPDFPASLKIVLDIIPADFVVNGILAASAHIARIPGGFDLFTVASSSKNPLWFESLYENVRDYFVKHPFTDRAGKPIILGEWKFRSVPDYRRMMLNRYLRPAKLALAIVNRVPVPGSRKWRPRLKNIISKIEQLIYYVDIYGPYVNLDCRFETEHAAELLQSLVPEEREAFNFDPRRFHWRNYLQDVHIPGLKRNILRMEEVPRTGAGQGKLLEEEQEAGQKRRAIVSVRGVPQTIVELALRGKERFGNKPMAEIRRSNPENGPAHVRLSYAEMYDRATDQARLLAARLNLHAGDRVALLGENCPEWALGYLSVSRAGATVVPLDRTMPPAEIARILKFTEAKAILISPNLFKQGAGHLGQGNGLPPCLNLLAGLTPFDGQKWPVPGTAADVANRTLREPSAETLASILFTSGTTLDPKGVMLHHSNFIANAMAVAEVLEPLESDRFLSVLPMHHAFEFTAGFLIPMYGGSTVHHLEVLRGQEILDTMKLNEITVMIGVPRLFKLFMDGIRLRIEQAGVKGRVALEAGEMACLLGEVVGCNTMRPKMFRKVHDAFGGHVRAFVSGGAALDPEIFHFFRRFGITICEGYGLTETSPVLTVNPMVGAKAGSVGSVIPGMEISIQNLGDEENVGEVLARGPSIMHGYWRNPAATAAVMENGWFKTGDLGRLDHEGYLHITGRLKDIIVTSAGKNVYPDDVEYYLKNLSGVKELCVVGLPGRNGQGEEVTAVLVLDAGANKENIVAEVAHRTRDLPSHQRIARVEFQTEELPKTSTLKVQRGKVRARYTGAVVEKFTAPATAALTVAAPEVITDLNAVEIEVARLVARVAGNLAPADISPAHKLQMDLGIDSIGRVDLLQMIEVRFGVTFPGEAEARIFTVQDVTALVKEAVGSDALKTKSQRRRALWERAHVRKDVLEAGMQQTAGRRVLRKSWDTVLNLVMDVHVRVRGGGLENLPKTGPYIIVANHSSHLDLPAIRKVLGPHAEKLHAMAAKDYFFDSSIKAWFFTTFLNALPLDREANAAESLAVCKTVLDSGRALLIFPEGTRTITGELQPFKPGIGVLAMELDVPLVPVWLQGTYAAWPKGRRFPRPGRVEVRIGPPVDLAPLKSARETVAASELYRRSAALLRERVEALADLPPIR
ncbi:MAG: AMP-binding protein [Verrucomicrobiota bacterium]